MEKRGPKLSGWLLQIECGALWALARNDRNEDCITTVTRFKRLLPYAETMDFTEANMHHSGRVIVPGSERQAKLKDLWGKPGIFGRFCLHLLAKDKGWLADILMSCRISQTQQSISLRPAPERLYEAFDLDLTRSQRTKVCLERFELLILFRPFRWESAGEPHVREIWRFGRNLNRKRTPALFIIGKNMLVLGSP